MNVRVSDVVSLVLNPSVMTGVFFYFLAAEYEPRDAWRVGHIALSVVFATLVPVGLVFLLKSRGTLRDINMSVRTERERLYLLCTAGYTVGVVLLFFLRAHWTLWGFLACHIPNTLAILAVNCRLKISIHSMVLTGLFVASMIFFGRQTAPVGILVLVAAWARWDAGNHSPTELICGALVGGVLTSIEIFALKALFAR